MNDTERGWSAGIIDGEGHIGSSSGGYGNHYARVVVTNTNFRIPYMMQTIFGFGQIYQRTNNKGAPRFDWYVTKKEDVKYLLESVRSLLVAKHRQADIALALVDAPKNSELCAMLREENQLRDSELMEVV